MLVSVAEKLLRAASYPAAVVRAVGRELDLLPDSEEPAVEEDSEQLVRSVAAAVVRGCRLSPVEQRRRARGPRREEAVAGPMGAAPFSCSFLGADLFLEAICSLCVHMDRAFL